MGIYSLIDQRANRALVNIVEDFSQYLHYKTKSENKIVIDSSKMGIDYLHASYKLQNKWMGRIYIFRWELQIQHFNYPEDIELKLRYVGNLGSKTMLFTSKKKNPLQLKLMNDPLIQDICRTIDFEYLSISYSKEKQSWSIEVWPNYGDYIWFLIPPMRYFRRPSKKEINHTVELFHRIEKHISSLRGDSFDKQTSKEC